MIEFEAKQVDLDINFADLDPELQPKLRSSKELAIYTIQPFGWYVVGTGHYEEERFWEPGRTRRPQHCRRGKCSAGYAAIPLAEKYSSLTGSAAPLL